MKQHKFSCAWCLVFILLNSHLMKAMQPQIQCYQMISNDNKINPQDVTSDEYENEEIDNTLELKNTTLPPTTTTIATNIPGTVITNCVGFCYTVWEFDKNNTIMIARQGCWDANNEACEVECVSTSTAFHKFCCCSGNLCNANFTVITPTEQVESVISGNQYSWQTEDSMWAMPYVWFVCSFLAMMLVILGGFLKCRRFPKSDDEQQLAPSGPGYSSNLYNVDNLKLVSMIGRGKYGTVWKGLCGLQPVAVKIFASQYKAYFHNEKDLYTTPLMENPTLLSYFGYDERRTLDDQIEYLLILSLAPAGCLQDWLLDNSTSFPTFCKMAISIATGIAHLHTEMRKGDVDKPCVVHRDINSRNILVKPDLSCCICDLGFSMKVYGPRYLYRGEMNLAETKSINEVGTLRYHAPEVLEGAVNLRDCESALKQIDIYSLGLVLWELCTRCHDFYYASEKLPPPYKAPYEAEIGINPTFEQMQILVSRHKARPLFPSNWGGGRAAKIAKETCEDCWDHDAEARLTALCVKERFQDLSSMQPRSSSGHHRATSPLLSTHNVLPPTPSTFLIGSPNSQKDAASVLTPPNQHILSTHAVDTDGAQLKNRDVFAHQIQAFQGRNPTMERNLVQPTTNNQIFVEKSKKHIYTQKFNNNDSERLNENYIIDDHSLVEELLGGSMSTPANMPSMGEGFPKQQNVECSKVKGWHSVRNLLNKKFFKKPTDLHRFHYNAVDEKSNLVDNRNKLVYKVNVENVAYADGTASPAHQTVVSLLNENQNGQTRSTLQNSAATRPTNLDIISPIVVKKFNPQESAADLLYKTPPGEKSMQKFSVINPDTVTTRIVVSKSANAVKSLQNNSVQDLININEDHFLKRQRSLEVFREVFGPKGSVERLRDPSQRVKTPGDVPPSVRKMRAKKTLSLYDDRMMNSGNSV